MNERDLMTLRILLPFGVLLEHADVRRVVAETGAGLVGVLPHRLDFASLLVPGILTYEAEGGGEQFVALDRGVLVKTGLQMTVSVRNGVIGGDLGTLRQLVDRQFVHLNESEREARSLLAKMESEIIRETTRLHHE